MRSCDTSKHQKTQSRMFERARVLGYSSLEECIRARILSGTTVRDLSGKLDVSESTLDKEMKKLGVRSQHQKRVRFWMV